MPETFLKIYFSEEPEKIYLCRTNTLLIEALSKFASSQNKTINDFFFFHNGSLININEDNKDLLLKDAFPKIKKTNEIKIFAFTGNNTKNINGKLNKYYYNDIICPKCETTAIIEKKGLNLNVLNCENFHYLKDITFDTFDQFVYDYNNRDKEYIKKYRCNICGVPKHSSEMDKMYICSCGCRVCDKCRNELHKPESKDSNENKGHFQVNIEDKNYYCLKHGVKDYTCYCLDCNANLCDECKKEHEKHDIENFNDLIMSKQYVRDFEENADEQNIILINFIENVRLLFDKIINTIDNYLNSHIMIQKSIIRRFKAKQLNYQLLKNLKNKTLFENDLFKEMKLINDQLDIKEEIEKKFKESNFIDKQVNLIFNQIYTPINEAIQAGEKKETEKTYAHGNKATILYEIPGKQFDRRVKLFDPVFVENNKDNISMVISCLEGENKNVIYKGPLISEYWNNRDANKLQVDLIEDKHGVTDMSYMLNNCKYAKDANFSGWKMINIISVEAMFQLCNFDKIPNIPMINVKRLENARALFCKCKNITTLDTWNDWLKWFIAKDDNKIKNMSMLFNGCINLKAVTFPKTWNNINSLYDISYMFNRCKNLTEVNNMSVLNTKSLKYLSGLFNGCINLTKIGKLSFKSQNIEDLSIMFQDCVKLPLIETSFDHAKSIKNISGMFAGCKSATKIIPGIYYTDNLINMAALCKGCEVLESLHDIGGSCKYNMAKVEFAQSMLSNCKKLRTVKWLANIKFKAGINFDEILKDSNFNYYTYNIKKEWEKNQIKPAEKK